MAFSSRLSHRMNTVVHPATTPMPLADAQRYCEQISRRSGSNFYYSFLFLPKRRRQAMYAVYAFCREVDRAVDEAPNPVDAVQQLDYWRRELQAAYRGMAVHPITLTLAEHARQLDIPQHYFEELLLGVDMDLTIHRYATFADLTGYCYRVASVVGLICLKVFGTRAPAAEEYAKNLGMAFQLTNILRDLRSDADRDRIYLPLEDLARFGYGEEDLFHRRYSPAFAMLMQFECARTRDFYRGARAIVQTLPVEDRRALTVAEIMRAVYVRILDRIERVGYRVYEDRIGLPSSRRLAIALGVWLRSVLRSWARGSRSALG